VRINLVDPNVASQRLKFVDPARGSPSSELFQLASVGGTFNVLHEGHKRYLTAAFLLARQVHILLSSDSYAKERKAYAPRRLAERRNVLETYLRGAGLNQRAEIEILEAVGDIRLYVITSAALDLVVTESTYFAWFDEWNHDRLNNGYDRYHILCKPRTLVAGRDVSSSSMSSSALSSSPTDASAASD
jgi:cytidyltransferase-like protein